MIDLSTYRTMLLLFGCTSLAVMLDSVLVFSNIIAVVNSSVPGASSALGMLLVPGVAFLSGMILTEIRTVLKIFFASLAVGYLSALIILAVFPSPLWVLYGYWSSGCPAQMTDYACWDLEIQVRALSNALLGLPLLFALTGFVGSILGFAAGSWRRDRRPGRPLPPYSGLSGKPLSPT